MVWSKTIKGTHFPLFPFKNPSHSSSIHYSFQRASTLQRQIEPPNTHTKAILTRVVNHLHFRLPGSKFYRLQNHEEESQTRSALLNHTARKVNCNVQQKTTLQLYSGREYQPSFSQALKHHTVFL